MLISIDIDDKLIEKFKEDYEKTTMLPVVDELELASTVSHLSTHAILEHVFSMVEAPIRDEQTSAYHTVIRLED